MLVNSWVAAQLAASQEGLSSMELGNIYLMRLHDLLAGSKTLKSAY
jgi:hypothetical protein